MGVTNHKAAPRNQVMMGLIGVPSTPPTPKTPIGALGSQGLAKQGTPISPMKLEAGLRGSSKVRFLLLQLRLD